MTYSIKASWQSPRENVSYSPLLMSNIFYNHLSRASLVLLQSHSAFFYFSVIRDPWFNSIFWGKHLSNKSSIITGHISTKSASTHHTASNPIIISLLPWFLLVLHKGWASDKRQWRSKRRSPEKHPETTPVLPNKVSLPSLNQISESTKKCPEGIWPQNNSSQRCLLSAS